ncbi:conserved hypothetical protein [Mesorhizobium opportunistum WSM2075]|uniref:Transmembrane protein n=2 Tax=Mesorhizobium opportunistum TaxID=593909 RepID=F7Y0U9_MESOW|nr:conserved hypothetical protein [Mesorhizobium opportunistum WSM2075]
MPAFGQALWVIGFAQSFANSLSIFASDIGNPASAAIAFGLPAALATAAFLKLGFDAADAYSLAFASWLLLAFWGCYRLGRLLNVGRLLSLSGAAMWLSTPMLWMHESYSATALGMSLLPFYAMCAWPIVWADGPVLRAFPLFVVAAVIAVFMDGYTFMMFAVAVGCTWIVGALRRSGPWTRSALRIGLAGAAFLIAYVLYVLYIGRTSFDLVSLDIFRGWGANIEFLLRPVLGLLWLSDWTGFAESRSATDYFGDPSVFTTSHAVFLMLAAAVGLIINRGDRRAVYAFIAIALIGFYFSLGPSFKFYAMKPGGVVGGAMPETYAPIPTGTAWISSNLPGFDAMRAAYRWSALGMFGLWAAFMASTAARRSLAGVPILVACAVMLLNLPHMTWLDTYIDHRQNMLAVEAVASNIDQNFTDGERVFFAPWGNDFFVTFLAPTIGISAFNIGGDKNMAIAVKQWPDVLQAFPQREADRTIGPNYADLVTTVLTTKTADAVALSFIDNFAPTQGWPVDQEFKGDLLRLADTLEANPALSVTRTDDYAIIRLRH